MKPLLIWLTMCVFFLSATSVISSPQDARKRISQMNDVNYPEEDDIKAEIRLGRKVAARILGSYGIYKNDAITRYLNLVGKGVALQTGRPEIEFRFAVIDTDNVNAFATPGGYIFITLGALKMMEDEAELAAVLAHEIAHIQERHIEKELDIQSVDNSPTAALTSLISGTTDVMSTAFQKMMDKAVEILFETGCKKQDEMDADTIATSLITTANYNPIALKRYLKRINKAQGIKTKQLNKTHPPFAERIKNLERFLSDNALLDKKQSFLKERFHKNATIH